jgi:hypothetical protein
LGFIEEFEALFLLKKRKNTEGGVEILIFKFTVKFTLSFAEV